MVSKGVLALEDGTFIEGIGFGAEKEVFGEIVFNTAMTGYEEAFTDPSYAGQILIMTYPLIGNYGFSPKSGESPKIQIQGLVTKEPAFSSYRRKNLIKYLTTAGIPGIGGIDTRALTLKIRYYGTMKAILANTKKSLNRREILERIKKLPYPDTENLVRKVSCPKIIFHRNHHKKKILLIDCGCKKSIITNLLKFSSVIQAPYNITFETIRKINPSGIVISNGPGNPAHPEILSTTVQTVKKLLGLYPIFGICLGHQILGLALGLRTYKLKFGHRGVNHPVKSLENNKVFITSQNHGYALTRSSNIKEIEFNWVNVNDGTVEGMVHRVLPIISVQFHPEGSPGPNDTTFLFQRFIEMT